MSNSNIRLPNGKLSLYEAIENAMKPPTDPALMPVRRSAGLSPSSASALIKDPVSNLDFVLGTCLRNTYYKIVQQEPDADPNPDPRFSRICEAGDLISNKFVYEPAKKAGVWAGEELSFFDPDNMLSGRLDLMAVIPNTDEKVIVEVKSMSPFMEIPWIKADQRGFKYLEPRFKDIPQLMSYMQWFLQYGVKWGALYYCSREMNTNMFMFEWANVPADALRPADNAYLRCHSSERTWDLDWLTWGQIRDRYNKIKNHLKTGTLPPRDFEKQYSNRKLLDLAANAGNGSQFIDISATDSAKVQAKFRSQLNKTKSKEPEEHESYLEKGSYACEYCEFKNTCWSGLGNQNTPKVNAENWEQDKAPKAPVAEPSKKTPIVIPRK